MISSPKQAPMMNSAKKCHLLDCICALHQLQYCFISDHKELSQKTSKLQHNPIKDKPITPNTQNYDNLAYFANVKGISALTSVGFVSSEFGFYVKG